MQILTGLIQIAHTMFGNCKDQGICPRVFDELFELGQTTRFKSQRFVFELSCLEVYNEEVLDLMQENKALQLRSDGKEMTIVDRKWVRRCNRLINVV